MVGNFFFCMSMNLFFIVEYDENYLEGVQGGYECVDQICYYQIDMVVCYCVSQDFIFIEEVCSDQWQC